MCRRKHIAPESLHFTIYSSRFKSYVLDVSCMLLCQVVSFAFQYHVFLFSEEMDFAVQFHICFTMWRCLVPHCAQVTLTRQQTGFSTDALPMSMASEWRVKRNFVNAVMSAISELYWTRRLCQSLRPQYSRRHTNKRNPSRKYLLLSVLFQKVFHAIP